MKSLIFTKLLFLGILIGTVAANAKEALAPQVTLEELKNIVDKKSATIIDANGVTTYKKGHIPTAINYAQHEKDLKAVLPADKKSLIVAYCGGPLCTAWEQAAKDVQALGYTNVKHYKGGLKGWKEAGYKLTSVK